MTDNLTSQPQSTFNVLETGAVVVSIVIGVGIFKTPALVAANVHSDIDFLLSIQNQSEKTYLPKKLNKYS